MSRVKPPMGPRRRQQASEVPGGPRSSTRGCWRPLEKALMAQAQISSLSKIDPYCEKNDQFGAVAGQAQISSLSQGDPH